MAAVAVGRRWVVVGERRRDQVDVEAAPRQRRGQPVVVRGREARGVDQRDAHQNRSRRYPSDATAPRRSSAAKFARTLRPPDVGRGELPDSDPATPGELERDPDVLGEEDPARVLLERPERLDLLAGQVAVGELGEIERAGHDEPAPDGRARVDLDQLEGAVAQVVRHLDVREARVARRAEQPLALLLDLGDVVDLEDRRRAEVDRALAHLAPDDAPERLARAADVGEERVDAVGRVRDELLDDHVEPVLPGAPPDRYRVVEALGDDRLLPEGGGELLALRRLDEEGRLEAGSANRLLVARQDGPGRGHAGLLGLEHEDLLAAHAARDLRVAGKRDVGDLGHLVPAVEDELDVLVALREEDDTAAVGDAAQGVQQRVAGIPEAVVAEEHALAHVARGEPELVAAPGDAGDGRAGPAERAHDGEPRVEEPEDDGGACAHASAAS